MPANTVMAAISHIQFCFVQSLPIIVCVLISQASASAAPDHRQPQTRCDSALYEIIYESRFCRFREQFSRGKKMIHHDDGLSATLRMR
jgi:hypothetical protein